MIVAILQMDGEGKPGLSARVRITAMHRPAVVKTHLPLFQSHGHDANVFTVGAEFLLQLIQILIVEVANILQTLPAMTPRHHD